MKKKSENEATFEELLTQLEEMIDKLSDEETGVEEVLSLYKKGQELVKSCEERLTKVEVNLKLYEAEVENDVQ